MKIIITILALILLASFIFYLTNRISVLEAKECITWLNKEVYPDYPEKFSDWQREQCQARGVLK